ncbi:hypothetical protein BS11774_01205 [Bacillus subtilis]|nr:hypothetical protein BS11774_01205 [Bacillus subtilis]
MTLLWSKITFLDGEELIIERDTFINGYKADGFYLQNVFTDTIDGHMSTGKADELSIATTNPKIGITGFILSVDCFSIGLDHESNKHYLSSAVKSIENI